MSRWIADDAETERVPFGAAKQNVIREQQGTGGVERRLICGMQLR